MKELQEFFQDILGLLDGMNATKLRKFRYMEKVIRNRKKN